MELPMAKAKAMAMVMVMLGSEHKPPSMRPSQDEAHPTIGDFNEIAVANSDNDLHLIRVTSARLHGWMPAIPEVEIWRMVSLLMFHVSLLFSLLRYFFVSQPSTYAVRMGFRQLQRWDKRRWSFPGCRMRRNVALSGPDQFRDLWVHTIAYVEWLFDSFLSFLLLYRFMQPKGSAPKEGDNLMAWLHVTCPGPGNTDVLKLAHHERLISSDHFTLTYPYTTLQYGHPCVQQYLLIYLLTRPYPGIRLYSGLQIALSMATYITLRSMSVLGVSVWITNWEIMSLLTSDTPTTITPYMQCSAMPTSSQLMPNCRHDQGFNNFQHVPCIVSDLPKPNLLHTMHIGMLEHLQKWFFHFMKIQ